MTRHYPMSRLVSVGLVLLTLLASLLVTTQLVSVTHAAPTTHVPLTQYGQPPLSWVGKLFIPYTVYVNGVYMSESKVCTGAVVHSSNGSVVETAAHCFFGDEGQLIPARNMEFCPQYHDEQKPRGCWEGKQVFVAPNYTPRALRKNPSIGDPATDYGFLMLYGRAGSMGGKTVESVVGGVTPVHSVLVGTNPVVVYGYPDTAATSNGQSLYMCTESLTTEGQVLQLNGCVMGPGASGGPWFVTINGSTYLIGLQSRGNDTMSSSPDFATSGWFALFARVA